MYYRFQNVCSFYIYQIIKQAERAGAKDRSGSAHALLGSVWELKERIA